MLKSCQYCGRIHKKSFDCGRKPKKENNVQSSFRNTSLWKKKTTEIKERDLYLCRVCLAAGRVSQLGLEVHHIIPIEEDFDKRLDNDNLLLVCRKCHEECESGQISRQRQRELAMTVPDYTPLDRKL